MSNLLKFDDRNTLGYTFFDPLNEWQHRELERRMDRVEQMRGFGSVKRIPNTGPDMTAEELKARAERVIIMGEKFHRQARIREIARGEYEGLEEFYARMGHNIEVPVRCKRCGDPVKDDTEPCEKCKVEEAEVMNDMHR